MENPISKHFLLFIKNQLNIEAYCTIDNNKYVICKKWGCFLLVLCENGI